MTRQVSVARYSLLLSRGVDATSRKYREASLFGADGVVIHRNNLRN